MWYDGYSFGMLIKNFQQLATTPLRRAALEIVSAGLDAVKTDTVINRHVRKEGSVLIVQGKRFPLKRFKRIFFVGIGKAALEGARTIEKVLGKHLTGGIALDMQKGNLRKIQSIRGDHPYPSKRNVQATKKITSLLKGLNESDLLIALISGGGSALLCSYYEATYKEEEFLTKLFFQRGVAIHEMNSVRKHISDIKGGGLAKMAYPATVIGLIFSDVPGCGPEIVASGPTYPDTTTVRDAARIVRKYKLPKLELFETPKDRKYFQSVHNFLLVCNDRALRVMAKKARALGFRPKILSSNLNGEAKKLGLALARRSRRGWALLAAGETIVKIKGKGKGGRNQELVLGALAAFPKDALVLSINSDGRDNTSSAGALGDAAVIEKMRALKLVPGHYLAINNSYEFFQKVGTHIITGPTGINISDLMVVLRS